MNFRVQHAAWLYRIERGENPGVLRRRITLRILEPASYIADDLQTYIGN